MTLFWQRRSASRAACPRSPAARYAANARSRSVMAASGSPIHHADSAYASMSPGCSCPAASAFANRSCESRHAWRSKAAAAASRSWRSAISAMGTFCTVARPMDSVRDSTARSRHLDWDGCLNLRDLGGLPIEAGGSTAWGAFVRGDTLCGLTETGRGALLGYGIRTVIDLRSSEEITREPNPFAALPDVVSYVHQPLNDPATESRLSVTASATERYLVMIDAAGTAGRLAAGFGPMAGAPPRGGLVPCFAGRDPTRVVAAPLLRPAGGRPGGVVGGHQAAHEAEGAGR